MLRPETLILSEALSDIAGLPPQVRQGYASGLLRSLDLVPRPTDPDFEDTVAAGYADTDVDAWYSRTVGGAR